MYVVEMGLITKKCRSATPLLLPYCRVGGFCAVFRAWLLAALEIVLFPTSRDICSFLAFVHLFMSYSFLFSSLLHGRLCWLSVSGTWNTAKHKVETIAMSCEFYFVTDRSLPRVYFPLGYIRVILLSGSLYAVSAQIWP